MGWVTDKGNPGLETFEKGGKVKEAKVGYQVKKAWKDFEERSPKAAKELKKVGRAAKETGEFLGDIVTFGGVTRKKKRKKQAQLERYKGKEG